MNFSEEEMALIQQWNAARTAFIEAKKDRAASPEAYKKAKAEMQELRHTWREIRSAGPAGLGTAAPAAIQATTSVKGD